MKFKKFVESMFQNNIKNAFEKGINLSDKAILGLHGTSLHTMENALKTGYIQAGINTSPKTQNNWGIFMFPNPDNPSVKNLQFRRELIPLSDAMEEAKLFAATISSRHRLMKNFNFDFTNQQHLSIALDPMKDNKYQDWWFKDRKNSSKGFVLSISEEATKQFSVHPGGDGDDIVLVCKQLPVNFILGIEPVGDTDYDYLDSLFQ